MLDSLDSEYIGACMHACMHTHTHTQCNTYICILLCYNVDIYILLYFTSDLYTVNDL